jgi:hypothetical protein
VHPAPRAPEVAYNASTRRSPENAQASINDEILTIQNRNTDLGAG